MFSSVIEPICIMCFLVLLQATYRSIVVRTLDFCRGVSDYKWSMWILVITQLAIFAIAFIVPRMVEGIVGEVRCCTHKAREDTASTLDSWINEFGLKDRLSQRKMSVCVDNISKWMNVKRDSPAYQHTLQLLSKYHLSTAPPLLNRFLEVGNRLERYRMTSLSMVVLAKVVPPLLQSSSVLAKSMTDALCEAFEIVYYIDKKMNVESDDSGKRQLAKLLWEGGEIDMISEKVLLENWEERGRFITKRLCELDS
ncbi:hypothetical protein Syun_005856 [Stephania yunnanensis]|uniref:Uncharacterized protein n=1 Tax=Stephania yunnanensis TaxID=152371 RepID=A0AAP0KWK2_9MAGN